MSSTIVRWRGLELHGTSGPSRPFAIRPGGLDGWEGRAPVRTVWEARSQRHGAFAEPLRTGERTVTVRGFTYDPVTRDALFAQLDAVTGMEDSPDPLEVQHAGRTLSSPAFVAGFWPVPNQWGDGWFDWQITWMCPDPLRYGAEVVHATTFAQDGGFVRWPAVPAAGVLFGDATSSSDGTVTLPNSGTAPAWPVLELTGPIGDGGVDLRVGSTVLARYAAGIPAGSTVAIDTATGVALLDGVADVSTNVPVRAWTPIPPAGALTVRLVAREAVTTGTLTGRVRPTYW